MSPLGREGLSRIVRLSAVLLASGAALSWVTPRSVPGKNLVPFGCGAPAGPKAGELAEFVCSDQLAGARSLSVALVVAAGMLLLVGEVVLPRFGKQTWAQGLAAAAPVSFPVLLVAALRIFEPVGTEGADGAVIRCGTAFAPSTDAVARLVCGDLAQTHRYVAVGAMLLGLLLLVGAMHVASAWSPPDPVAPGDTTSPAAPGPGHAAHADETRASDSVPLPAAEPNPRRESTL